MNIAGLPSSGMTGCPLQSLPTGTTPQSSQASAPPPYKPLGTSLEFRLCASWKEAMEHPWS